MHGHGSANAPFRWTCDAHCTRTPIFNAVVALAMGLTSVHAADTSPQPSGQSLVQARLVAEPNSLRKGKTGWLAVHLTMKPGWHIYWRNPGDAGIATSIDWRLTPGVTAGPIAWPQPERFAARSIVAYGYSGEIALLTRLQLPRKRLSDRIKIEALVSWLACAEVCIPGSQQLTMSIPEREAAAPQDAALFERTLKRIPRRAAFRVAMRTNADSIHLSVPKAAWSGIVKPQLSFYPYDNSIIDHGAAQFATVDAEQIDLRLQPSAMFDDRRTMLNGLLIVSDAQNPTAPSRAFDVSATRGESQ